MSPDDIDRIALAVYDLLVLDLGCDLGEGEDWEKLKNLLYDELEPFVTRERNYN
jgi:hypothetical protein